MTWTSQRSYATGGNRPVILAKVRLEKATRPLAHSTTGTFASLNESGRFIIGIQRRCIPIYVKIKTMSKPQHSLINHTSYQLHRKQMWTQILLPILVAVLVFIAVIIITSMATFRGNGDVYRWAAISTIWLVLPVIFGGLVFLILLIALIYLMARLTALIPPYSFQAQQIVHRVEEGIERTAQMVRKPKLAFNEFVKLFKAYAVRFQERRK